MLVLGRGLGSGDEFVVMLTRMGLGAAVEKRGCRVVSDGVKVIYYIFIFQFPGKWEEDLVGFFPKV